MNQDTPVPTKKPPDPSELKIALDNRAFEIQLFWQRSNYFLVLMTALGIGAFTVKDPLFSPVIALFATVCSYYWFRTNLGSKFWQESWEVEVTELSKELSVRSFERSLSEVRDQVSRSLESGQGNEKRSFVRKWIDRLTIKKYSVTFNMILLSLISTALWFLVAVTLMVRSMAGEDANKQPRLEAVTQAATATKLTTRSVKPPRPERSGPARHAPNRNAPIPRASPTPPNP